MILYTRKIVIKLRIEQYLLEKVEGSVRLYTARSMIFWTL